MAQAAPARPNRAVTGLEAQLLQARQAIHRRVSGYDEAITHLFVALATRGNVLVEGIPGVGKTTLARTFAEVTGLGFARIQLTPDLMPSDLTGHLYYDQNSGNFRVRKGPIFTNILLADEINRTPPRTQAALLEVMQERQVTIEGRTMAVPDPFLVVATKNPIETEGVYRLPEAELDRFMLHVRIDYAPREIERAMLAGKLERDARITPLPGLSDALAGGVARVYVHPDLIDYILDIVHATRKHEGLELGASPRAAEHLLRASRGLAVVAGRDYVVPDDVKRLAGPVLRHRLILTAEAEIEDRAVDALLAELVEAVRVPIGEDAARG